MISKRIDRNSAQMRLDRFLRREFSVEPLSKIFSILRKKKVRVNGKVAKANLLLKENDEISIYENLKSARVEETKTVGDKNFPSKEFPLKKKIPLDIVFSSDEFIIVNKPAGLSSQPGSGTLPGESLVEVLWEWGKENGKNFPPTLVHRLDKETSGVILSALHGDTLRDLSRLVRERKIDKHYFALVVGNLEEKNGTISSNLLRTDAKSGSKMLFSAFGKKSITHYSLHTRFEGFDLVDIRLETGRMHQIRAHFASIGHPLAGDSRYGDFQKNRELRKAFSLRRLFLHSFSLSFEWNGKKFFAKAPLPKELEAVLSKLNRVGNF